MILSKKIKRKKHEKFPIGQMGGWAVKFMKIRPHVVHDPYTDLKRTRAPPNPLNWKKYAKFPIDT